MLSKRERIERKDFGPLLMSRIFLHSPSFTLRLAKNPLGRAQAAVSVSKKVSKRAVVRNSIRRRTYSVLQALLPRKDRMLFFFVAKPGSDKVKGEALHQEINNLLKSAERRYNS